MLGDAEKRARYDRFGHAGVSGQGGRRRRIQPRHLLGLLGHPRRLLRLRRRRRPPAGAGPRVGPPLRPRDLVRRVVHRHRDDDSDSARGELRDMQGHARRTGHVGRNVLPVPRHGPTALPAGIPHRLAPLRPVPGVRARSFGIPVRPAAAPDAPPRTVASPCGFRPASPTDSGSACTARANTARSAVPPATCTWSIHVKPHAAFHREEDDLFVEVPVPFHIMAMGGTFEVDGPGGAIYGRRLGWRREWHAS